jgi:hypothetical protein
MCKFIYVRNEILQQVLTANNFAKRIRKTNLKVIIVMLQDLLDLQQMYIFNPRIYKLYYIYIDFHNLKGKETRDYYSPALFVNQLN